VANISVVIPVFNEKQGLEKTAGQMHELLGMVDGEIEVIFVDDGSSDGSSGILDNFDNHRFRVVRHEVNKGYGAALKTGIKNAKYEHIVITDADCTYPTEKIPELVGVYEKGGYDMVVGARKGESVQIPMVRKPAKWFLKCLAEYLTERKIPDLNSGLRVMRKEVVEGFVNILPDGFSFTTTITLAMLTNNHSVKYININYNYRRGDSKIRPIYDTINFIQLILRTTLYFNPLRIFVPLSLFFAASAFLVFILSWVCLDRIMDVSSGVLLMTAVMVMAIGMLAELIDKRVR